MEADVDGELVKEVKKENVNISVMTMGDDCTSLARIRQELAHSVENLSDLNDAVKHLGNSLYSLQKKNKVLSTKVIKHLHKCLNYALAYNKGNDDDWKAALKQTVPHLFGDNQSIIWSVVWLSKRPIDL
ncbi:hypothetical protein DPMN_064030 [Dreissena polymorpha]|uniref:Mutator-like transposase domain-containing protein n=1 Tax=Dreissena polymorpha TaxID=45954 RepID=A0A9D4HKT2_DREPO|nr:hypothetical protein DPMN_064030 [Dreissena polymorpha]